jgi:hypothetical protein
VWLEPRTTLRGYSYAAMGKWAVSAIQNAKWPPMLTAYDKAGQGARTAASWSKAFRQGGKVGGEKALTAQRGFERTLLAAQGAESAVTDYVAALKKDQPLRAWAKRDVEAGAYSWDLGSGRSSSAKAAKATKPMLAPLNEWGFTTLRR